MVIIGCQPFILKSCFMKPLPYLLVFFVAFLMLTQCKKEDPDPEPEPLPASISEDFECGNIGDIVKVTDTEWELSLANDNNNSTLPDHWRNWWYVLMDNVNTDTLTTFTIKNRGWEYYYVPVYSYDNNYWRRFSEQEVTLTSDNEFIIRKQFSKSKVWVARFYPYSLSMLEDYLSTINGNPWLEVETYGLSQEGRPVYLLHISDFSVKKDNKEQVLIHARTHPAETSPSFMLEGMIDFLLGGSAEAAEILATTEFHIFPMQNVDGVVAGNYRTTPNSENLEIMWYYDSGNPGQLTSAAPQEVRLVHDYALELMHGPGKPVTMALNLHASNSAPDVRPFFFPHFGPESLGYAPDEAALWGDQLRFISAIANHYGASMLEPVGEQGGSSFASKTYPESWWWVNYGPEVMAITMELTYGRAGYSPYWITPENMHTLGEALGMAIGDYYSGKGHPCPEIQRPVNPENLLHPGSYPPLWEDEGKN